MSSDLARSVARAGREPARVFQFSDVRKQRWPMLRVVDDKGREWYGPPVAPWLVLSVEGDSVLRRALDKWGHVVAPAPAVLTDQATAMGVEVSLSPEPRLVGDLPVYDLDGYEGLAICATLVAYVRRTHGESTHWVLTPSPSGMALRCYSDQSDLVAVTYAVRLNQQKESVA